MINLRDAEGRIRYCRMDEAYWTEEYRKVSIPTLNPTLVGFNVNLDRIIPVDSELLGLPGFGSDDLSELRSRLIHSMEHCTAEEWFVSDTDRYDRFLEFFSGTGSLTMGGQAGIAALHLKMLGVPEVICLAPAIGKDAGMILAQHGVHVPGRISGARAEPDTVHLVFEYRPGMVPLAVGARPRNNRFIASPKKTAKNTLMDEEALRLLLPELSSCTRAFLSGYQYLRDEAEFVRAAGQIRALKSRNSRMRVHIECVSVTDAPVLRGLMHHILPAADSAGMNEHELALLSGTGSSSTPSGMVQRMLTLARETSLSRIHLHTFGYYLLVIRKDRAVVEISRAALLFAARVVAEAAGGTGTGISAQGIAAVREIAGSLAPGPAPGIFVDGDYLVLAVPTLIAHGIHRTVGLGDILSSTAFVADQC